MRAGTPPVTWEGVLVVAIGMSIYAYLSLSTSAMVFRVTFLLLIVLEIVRIVLAWKSSSRLDIAFEVAFFLVLLSVFLGAYRNSLIKHPLLLFATIFYRPNYIQYGNRRLAFTLSVLIAGFVLPVTLGVVTDPGVVQIFSGLYALLVLCLWVFCSKLGAGLLAD